MDTDLWMRMLGVMTDVELHDLSNLLYKVQNFRTEAQVRSGDCAQINEVERAWLINSKKIEAIKSYRARTGSSLRFAKYVMDQAQEDLKL